MIIDKRYENRCSGDILNLYRWLIVRTMRVMSIDNDGYRLWLRYRKIDDDARLAQYRQMIGGVTVPGDEDDPVTVHDYTSLNRRLYYSPVIFTAGLL